jgi:hypothetical protein
MTTTIDCDPYFDDEDEENEANYRQLLENPAKLPDCLSTITPVSSVSQRSTLCSRKEAEHFLKSNSYLRPGNFILRPSAHRNHPYSLSVLYNDNMVFHFQIGQISHEYVMGPLESIDGSKSKKFSSISALLEYYLTSPIIFHGDTQDHSILLELYSPIEITRF